MNRDETNRLFTLGAALLFVFGVLYRLLSLFPPEKSPDVLAYALQALDVLDGRFPLFYYGQKFMGTGGSFLIAFYYKLFGTSWFSLQLFGYTMAVAALFLAVYLAYRFFGPRAAFTTALFSLIPSRQIMSWAHKARPDYGLTFILVPVILLLTHRAIEKNLERESSFKELMLLGFVSGFGAWNNLLIVPAILVSLMALLAYFGRGFVFRPLLLYGVFFGLGFLPEIVANIQMGFFIFKVKSGDSLFALPGKIENFFTYAVPYFWGWEILYEREYPRAMYFFLAWIGVLYALFIHRWLFGRLAVKERLAYHLTGGYLVLHLAASFLTHFGSRYSHVEYPTAYIQTLYAVAFVIPGAVLARLPWKKTWPLVAVLPIALYLVQQVSANREQVRTFVAFVRDQRGDVFASALIGPDHPYYQVARQHQLAGGYSDDFAGSEVRFLTGNTIPISRTYEEVNTPLSLQVDALERPFWRGATVPEMEKYFAAFALPFETVPLPRPFGPLLIQGKSARSSPGSAIDAFTIAASPHESGAVAMTDRSIQTFWSTVRPQKKGDSLLLDFTAPVPLGRLLLIPENFATGPVAFSLEVSDDATVWRRILAFEKHRGPVFVSVFHPMVKIVKPRIELNLKGEAGRYLRLRIEADGVFPLSIREVYVYRQGTGSTRPEDLSREVREIEDAIHQWPGARIVGDHWFESYFALKGYPVDFLPNRFVDLYGTESPALSAFEALPLSQGPAIVICGKEDSPAVQGLLASEGLSFRKREFSFYDLYFLAQQNVRNPLYWDGVRFSRLTPGAGGDLWPR